MWNISKAFGTEHYRVAVSSEKHHAHHVSGFATSWKMYMLTICHAGQLPV